MKKSIFILGLLVAFIAATPIYESVAQSKIMVSEYNLATDTVTNTGTGYVEVKIPGKADYVTFQAIATKISGTVAGVITLQGSLDGTNYKELAAMDSKVAMDTATNVASQSFIWQLMGNPCPYYRISWTGSGTMAATLAGRAFPNK